MKTKLFKNYFASCLGLFSCVRAVQASAVRALMAIIISATVALGNSAYADESTTSVAKQASLVGGVDHVGLAVSNLEDSKTFFTETLGFKVLGKDTSYPAYFLNNGSITITLWQTTNGEKAIPFNRKTNVGLHHLAFQVESLAKLNQLHETLQSAPKVTIEFAPENLGKGPTKHMMIREPSGNRLEFIHRARR